MLIETSSVHQHFKTAKIKICTCYLIFFINTGLIPQCWPFSVSLGAETETMALTLYDLH